MAKLSVFNQISLDGYFRTSDGDVSWTHAPDDDAEYRKFVEGNASSGGALLFGRKTYEMMAGFWPTPEAMRQLPAVAKGINAAPKFVVSKSLKEAEWNNTTILSGDPLKETQKLKAELGTDITIMGSGTLIAPLARAGLIDELKLVVFPVVLGEGKTMFEGIAKRLNLQLKTTRPFKNGKVYLVYTQ